MSQERTSFNLLFRNIPNQAFFVVSFMLVIFAVIMFSLWALSETQVFAGLGYSLLYIFLVSQPIALYFRSRQQTDNSSFSIALAIAVLAIPLAVLIGAGSHSTSEVLSFMSLPLLALASSAYQKFSSR